MKLLKFLSLLLLTIISSTALAESDAEFPNGWESWPIHHSGTILGKETAIPTNLPPIVIETMKTYNWVNDGKGTAYNLRLNPSQKVGDYQDGPIGILELIDIKVLFVTDHLIGEPQYGVYSYDGEDISGAHPTLKAETCTTCHSGYGDACIAGICTK